MHQGSSGLFMSLNNNAQSNIELIYSKHMNRTHIGVKHAMGKYEGRLDMQEEHKVLLFVHTTNTVHLYNGNGG